MSKKNTYKKSDRKNILFELFDFLIFGNIWIAFGAGLMYVASIHLISNEIILNSEALQVFGATLFAYNFLRFKSLNHHKFQHSPIAKWMKENKGIIYLLMILGLLLVLIPFVFVKFSFPYFIVWGSLILFTLLYLPFRKYWWLKNFFVALVWTFATFILAIVSVSNLDLKPTLFFAGALIFFYLSISLPFEIRDMKYDKSEKPISNFALIYGSKKTKVWSIALSFIAFVLFMFTDFRVGFIFIPVLLCTILFILKSKAESSEYLFTFGFDGLIVLFASVLFLQCLLF